LGTSSYNSFTGDTYSYGDRANPACGFLAPASIGIMYSLPYTDGNSVTITACPYSGSDIVVTTYRRSGTCNNGACYTCQAPFDAPSGVSCESFVVTANQGETIYFFVSGFSASTNVTFSFGIERTFTTAPAAAPSTFLPTCLIGSQLSFNIPTTRSLSSTRTAGFSSSCASLQSSQRGDWYRLPTGITGTVYLSTCDSSTTIDTQIVAFGANGNGCSTCACMSCFDANDNRNSTYTSLCTSTRSVLMLDLGTTSTTDRPVYIFVGAKSTTTTSGMYELTLSRDPFYATNTLVSPFTSDVTDNSGSSIGGIIGGVVGGFFFLVILIAIIVGCSRRRRMMAGGVVTMTMNRPQTATVMVTQQQVTTTALPMNSPSYVNTVEMQPMPMQDPNMMQPMMQPGMQPMQPGMQQMPPGYYT
jgi:hypothetical protein